MLDHWGIEPEWKLFKKNDKDKEWLKSIDLVDTIKKELIDRYDLVIQFENKINELDKIITGLCQDDKGYQNITENISGIGKNMRSIFGQ